MLGWEGDMDLAPKNDRGERLRDSLVFSGSNLESNAGRVVDANCCLKDSRSLRRLPLVGYIVDAVWSATNKTLATGVTEEGTRDGVC